MDVSRLLEIIRIKIDDFDDTEDELFTDDELIYYINNALAEAAFRGKLFVKENYSLELVPGQREYSVPANVISITQILDEDKRDVNKIQEVDFEQTIYHSCADNAFSNTSTSNDWRKDTDSLPYYFMQNTTNNKLVFYPIPNKISVVTMRGWYLPVVVESDDELPAELSPIYQHDLIYWVLFECYDKQDADVHHPGKAEENKQRFAEVFGEKMTADVFQEVLEYPDDPGSLRSY